MFPKTRLAVAIALAISAGAMTAQAGQIAFDSVPYPNTDEDRRDVLSSAKVQVNGIWQPGGFETLIRSGDELPLLVGTTPSTTETAKFGVLIQEDGTKLIDEATGEPAISNSNDFNSLITAGGRLYLVSHFETRPAAMYLTLLQQAVDGTLEPVATRPIDFSAVKGGWVHCAGSVTPWGTHMGSEEYEPDARTWVDPALTISGYNAAMHGYFDATGWTFSKNDPKGDPNQAKTLMNPYYYGWPVEVKVNADGSTEVTKHFALGRHANEISYVMPDNKTVYITDDGTNTLILMFVADTAGDLSAGTLYAARWDQIEDNSKGGRARLVWINLGHAQASDVKSAIDAGGPGGLPVKFDDLFDYTNDEPDACRAGGRMTTNSGHGGEGTPYYECLNMKAGVDETVVSRLETRRYAALKGATSEFRKVEGFTYNPERRTAYIAMSEINAGMLPAAQDASRHKGGNDHIQLAREDCGAVYSLRVGGRVRDAAGNLIASDYVARTMDGLVRGTTVPGYEDPPGTKWDTCDLNGIANPDNITYLPRYNSLIIGEDTGSGHRNDLVWNYNLLDGKLTRIQTTPYGSETTSVYWYQNLNNHGYLMSVIQHPYGESDRGLSTGPDDEYGYVGYFKFPALQ
jgi:hypothetical protein